MKNFLHVKNTKAPDIAAVAVLFYLVVCSPRLWAQSGTFTSPSKDAELSDLIIRPKPSEIGSAGLTVPPAMPAFIRPILSPSEQLIERAKALLGIPYKFAGNSPDTGFDCSGLVRFVFRDVLGISLPGRAEDIGRSGEKLSENTLSPGDLVFFNTLNRPLSHVGIYLGNKQFLHSPASGGVVRIESMTLPYWTKRYQGARRMVSQESQASTVAGFTPDLIHGVEILVGSPGQERASDGKSAEQAKSPDQLDSFLKKLKEKP